MANSITLKVLSSITSDQEVFNHLVEVERMDTNETGWLLCSHCCRWPQELLEKATWIEGCYTPPVYEGDPRLLLGYHPTTKTGWEIEKTDGGEVFVHLAAEGTSEGSSWVSVSLDFPAPIHICKEYGVNLEATKKAFSKRAMRLLRSLWTSSHDGERTQIAAAQAFYSSAVAAAQQGLIPQGCVQSAHLAIEEIGHRYDVIDWNPEDTRVVQVLGYMKVLKPSPGFEPAIELLAKEYIHVGGFCEYEFVRQEVAFWQPTGYAAAVPFELLTEEEDCITVNSPALELGYWPAVDMYMVEPYEEDGCMVTSIYEDDFVNGYAKAIDLRTDVYADDSDFI